MTSADVYLPSFLTFAPILVASNLPVRGMVCFCLGSQLAGLVTPIDSVLDTLPVPPAAPRVTSNDYPNGESCENMCFRKIDDTFMVTLPDHLASQHYSQGIQEDSVEWVEPDIDELQCILEIIPDTLPCGLAKLVRKPCREVLCATTTVFSMLTERQKGVYSAPATYPR